MQTAQVQSEYVQVDSVWLDDKPERPYDPWASRSTMKPYKDRPKGKLRHYFGTRFDIIARYLERQGVPLDTQCKAAVSGQNKMLTVGGQDYLTCIDGLIYTQKIGKGSRANRKKL